MQNIPDIVVIVGPNGSGKSALLEAINNFKETIGSYAARPSDPTVVNANASEATIIITFEITDLEKEYLEKNHNARFEGNERKGKIVIGNDGKAIAGPLDQGLSHILRLFDRETYPSLGIFEYFNPYRLLRKKQLNRLDFQALSVDVEKRRRIAEVDQKFDSLKDYLALLELNRLQMIDINQSGEQSPESYTKNAERYEQIKNTFHTFFSTKKFTRVDISGIQSGSPLKFMVSTPDGEVDIDNLSSGEKEILSVFVELHKLSPKNSIILFDEPDLHLNQALERNVISQLRNIGENNQIWITTHSFGIMDSAEYYELFRIENYSGSNQITRVFTNEEKLKTFKAVAGDVGIVSLGEKIIFLEGASEEIDKYILETWFPTYQKVLTFVSCGSVKDVMGVSQKALQLLEQEPGYNFFFMIRDRDYLSEEDIETLQGQSNGKLFIWDRYHIENYLLDEEVIAGLVQDTIPNSPLRDPTIVREKLVEIARSFLEVHLAKWIEYDLNRELRRLSYQVSPTDIENDVLTKTEDLVNQITHWYKNQTLEKMVQERRQTFEVALENEEWKRLFPGRKILSRFAGEVVNWNYKHIRNQLINRIQREGRIPIEVTNIIEAIVHFS